MGVRQTDADRVTRVALHFSISAGYFSLGSDWPSPIGLWTSCTTGFFLTRRDVHPMRVALDGTLLAQGFMISIVCL